MDRQTAQLFMHVGAVVVALGPTFALPFLQAFAEREGVASTRFMLAFSERIYQILVGPGSLVVFIFGVALIAANDRGYRDGVPVWLAACAAWFVLIIALSFHYQPAAVRKAVHLLDDLPDNASLPSSYTRAGHELLAIQGLTAVSTIVITLFMFWKPGE